jgi:hypothetical protein
MAAGEAMCGSCSINDWRSLGVDRPNREEGSRELGACPLRRGGKAFRPDGKQAGNAHSTRIPPGRRKPGQSSRIPIAVIAKVGSSNRRGDVFPK